MREAENLTQKMKKGVSGSMKWCSRLFKIEESRHDKLDFWPFCGIFELRGISLAKLLRELTGLGRIFRSWLVLIPLFECRFLRPFIIIN